MAAKKNGKPDTRTARDAKVADRKKALGRVDAVAKELGDAMFTWAAHKHLAIRAAQRAQQRIEKEARDKIARLQRVSSF